MKKLFIVLVLPLVLSAHGGGGRAPMHMQERAPMHNMERPYGQNRDFHQPYGPEHNAWRNGNYGNYGGYGGYGGYMYDAPVNQPYYYNQPPYQPYYNQQQQPTNGPIRNSPITNTPITNTPITIDPQ